jgi:pantetheine-phosphate adenylyltransferase
MTRSLKIAIFPGTFDPITNGHLDVIQRGQKMFDRLVVAVGQNPEKDVLFTVPERVEMIHQLVSGLEGDVRVESFDGLTVDFARQIGATVIVRGLRNVSDLHHEFQLALTNRAIAGIETIFIMTGEAYGFTSSSLIKQIAAGGDIDRLHQLIPPIVLQKFKAKLASSHETRAQLRAGAMRHP